MRKITAWTAIAVTGMTMGIATGMTAAQAPGAGWATLDGTPPLVIAHRGASGLRPEHTLAAYEVALEQGADIIEPDLQMSRDGVLIVRHDPYLSSSTDVADRPEFADRRAERFGREDWWVADFTAAELQSLFARQTMEDRSDAHDDRHRVLSFEALLDFVEARQAECGCRVAIEPEVKLPAQYAALGLDPLPALIAALDARGLNAADAPVIVQSFDPEFLRRLDAVSDVRLAMLYSGPEEADANAGGLTLEEIAAFADGVGPYKANLMTPDGDSTGYVEAAHAAGLVVHTWTVRDDRAPLVGETVEDELRALYALGVDGVFTDFPATAVRVRAQMSE
ncbi:glycerophosphodiester phosphodiesterase family protein [Marinicauda sp. Alg238-R41]|uniref:glycerophosphodiester phosphodiesterase family protein n=1 Tax=Marinicauda sp. Alg238-R41 TaxID=2993447 RepID=UPI0022E58D39|nr:glycerophosphodiester phosphodiesterase family protein [Marinicauda sp. Alg238-R41]